MKHLTQAEEEIMQLLWQLENAYVRDLIALMPEPKPAYNTVSTIVRILEQKGFVAHHAFGKSHQYYPLVSRTSYSAFATRDLMHKYFDNSLPQLVSHLARKSDLSTGELDQLLEQIQQLKNKSS
ncbi:MAG: BlaI/MecI/CopY family transcriptional regulator [Bacteroidia bacterium]